MDKEKMDRLQDKVGTSLEKQIKDLENITVELTKDLDTSIGNEREKNLALLTAAQNLLQQLREAQKNISRLIQESR